MIENLFFTCVSAVGKLGRKLKKEIETCLHCIKTYIVLNIHFVNIKHNLTLFILGGS